ncbi:MAG: sulfite exporter TauE/SafE family protein [Myxococcota bacterium]
MAWWAELLLIAVVGVVSGAINTIAGGGSLITLPMLIFVGLPPGVANGTNRVGAVLQSSTATVQFHREGLLNMALVRRLVLPTSIGAILGTWMSLGIDDDQFQTIIGVMMLIILPFVLLKPHKIDDENNDLPKNEGVVEALAEDPATPGNNAPLSPLLQALLFFGIGVYGGFLQAGVGVFLLTGLVRGCGCDLVRSNGIKVALVVVFASLATLIFAWQGMIAWPTAAALAVGSMVGGWIGTKMTVSWGPKFIRAVLIVTVLLSASKLVGLW